MNISFFLVNRKLVQVFTTESKDSFAISKIHRQRLSVYLGVSVSRLVSLCDSDSQSISVSVSSITSLRQGRSVYLCLEHRITLSFTFHPPDKRRNILRGPKYVSLFLSRMHTHPVTVAHMYTVAYTQARKVADSHAQ